MDYELDPCPFCGCADVLIAEQRTAISIQDVAVAACCRGCGARGPLRVMLFASSFDAAGALAADDWNAAHATNDPAVVTVDFDLGEETMKALAETIEQANKQNSDDKPATEPSDQSDPAESDAPIQADQEAEPEAGTEPAEDPQASEAAGGGSGEDATKTHGEESPSCPDSESNGSDRGGAATGEEINKRELASAVARLLKDRNLTQKVFAEMAGTHSSAVSCLIRGHYIGPADVKKIADFMKTADEPDYDESQVEKLPNKFDELNTGNKPPVHEPPPRHAESR